MKNLLISATVCLLALSLEGVAFAQYPSARIARPVEAAFNYTPASRGHVWAQQYASSRPWHGQHYYLPYGAPTALVVPPTAMMQQNYSWGVSRNTSTPIYHQFGSSGIPSGGGAFLGTPPWPSHTSQFGVYPVRAPW